MNDLTAFTQVDEVDFAVAAFRESGGWRVAELTPDHATDVETFIGALRRFSGEGGCLGMVVVDEDFFVIARVDGHETKMLLSDITAAGEWELAASVVESLGLPIPEDEDEDAAPAGDLALLEDLGLGALALAELMDDDELYPEEVLSDIARGLGFGELFDEAAGLTSA